MEAEQQEQQISPEDFVAYVTESDNLAAELPEGRLDEISQDVIADFKMDEDSMSDWLDRMERGLNLAKLVKEDKSYPFENSANIKYPLVTSAALQFNARAYPAIVPPDRAVKARVWGADPQGEKAARADRVSEHMSWQLAARIEEWEGETDKLLVQLPIVGTMVRKWWFDPTEGRTRCRLIDADKFIVNDKVKNLTEAPRMSEKLPLYPNEIESRIRAGMFVRFEYAEDGEDEQAPQDFIEQHCRLDLDEDGYDEPYIVTVHKKTQTVVRVIADFRPDDVQFKMEASVQPVIMQGPDGFPVQVMQETEVPVGIIAIKRGSYFADFHFMPSMDGGFHGTGLGLLLGDISDAINSTLNMLMDAGHYGTLGGGFIGANNFRLKGGATRLRPGEWKQVGFDGDDIRKGMVPMQSVKPDQTMFEMLGMLIDAGREIASVKDVMTGDTGGMNMQPTTLMALIDQGMQVFTAAYKRIFRGLKCEYKLLARLNAETISPEEYNAFHDEQTMFDPAEDYGAADMDIQPVADPRSVTKMQQAAKAQTLMGWAQQGLVNPQEAVTRAAEALDIEDVDALMPQPDPMQEQMMMLGVVEKKAGVKAKVAEIELTLSKVESERASATKDLAQAEAEKIGAKLDVIRARLEDERDELDRILRVADGMAQAGSDQTNARSGQGNVRSAKEAHGGSLPGGQSLPGT